MGREPLPRYISSGCIGSAEIAIVSEGSCLWAPRFQAPEAAWRRAMPEADAQGRIPIGFNVAWIRLGSASIIVDPGFDDPGSPWQQRFAATSQSLMNMVRTPGLQAALLCLGIAPEAVTHVLITHTHDDHFAGVTIERDARQHLRFPRARHLVGRADWERNVKREDPTSDLSVRLGAVHARGLLDPIDGEREVAPGLMMIPSPGETPGHMTIRVRSAGATFHYLGDLFHHSCEVEHRDWMPPRRDGAALRSSRNALIEDAIGCGATLLYSHGRFPGWGRIVRAADGARWEEAPSHDRDARGR